MKKYCCLLFFLPLLAGAGEIKFESGFENGLSDWVVFKTRAEIAVANEAAAGKQALEVRFDPGSTPGTRHGGVIGSKEFKVSKGIYRVTGKIRLAEGYGATVGIEFYNDANAKVGNNGHHFGSAPASPEDWINFDFTGACYTEDASRATVKLYLPTNIKQRVLLDDIRVEELPSSPQPPPWEPQYKIRPEEKNRLTPADFPGPDGIVYPDFSRAGVRPGVHDRPGVQRVTLKAKEGDDLLLPLRQAIAALPPEGGTIEIPAGNFQLKGFLVITRDFVTLKGAGRDRTRIDLTYDPGDNRVDLYGVSEGSRLAPKQSIHLYARPQGMRTLKLEVDGKAFGSFTRGLHSGNRSWLVARLPDGLTPGKHRLRGTALYQDGKTFTAEAEITLDPKAAPTLPDSDPSGVIHFLGKGFTSGDFRIAGDGRRGSSSVALRDAKHPFKAGDAVILRALETPERRAVTGNACNWGSFRSTHLFIEKVEGTKLTFNQPLRLDYPERDQSFVRKFDVVRGGRVEGMTLEMKHDFWSSAVFFGYAVDCLARDLKVIKCGRNPVYAAHVKFCSILNCEFDDAWYKGGGGTAYVGWENASDCLTDGVVARKMRHAPVVQWGASGNVIRNGTFHGGDAQWHAGWANENLFENCVVVSDTRENGGYGNAFWASAPEDGAHGPNGPRNVVYNCDTYSIATAVLLGGMNENWIFAHNRLRVKEGGGFFFKNGSFDHILLGNTVILEDKRSPFLLYANPNCGGVELLGNTFSGGSGQWYEGLQKPAVLRDNRVVPLDPKLPRPKPAVPSIYQWQLDQRK